MTLAQKAELLAPARRRPPRRAALHAERGRACRPTRSPASVLRGALGRARTSSWARPSASATAGRATRAARRARRRRSASRCRRAATGARRGRAGQQQPGPRRARPRETCATAARSARAAVLRGRARGPGRRARAHASASRPRTSQPENEILPGAGRLRRPVPACRGGALAPAVVNLGQRPTFGGEHATVEAHLLDFEGDLYGARAPARVRRAAARRAALRRPGGARRPDPGGRRAGAARLLSGARRRRV